MSLDCLGERLDDDALGTGDKGLDGGSRGIRIVRHAGVVHIRQTGLLCEERGVLTGRVDGPDPASR
jgi:hypothetical protein